MTIDKLQRIAAQTLERSQRSRCHYCGARNSFILIPGRGVVINVVSLRGRRWAHKGCLLRHLHPGWPQTRIEAVIAELDKDERLWWEELA